MIAKIALAALLTCDPALTLMFTPSRPQLGRYEVCTAAGSIEETMAADTRGLHYGDIEALEALDAFGAGGPYDRARLARLYGGTRVRVARGWTETTGGFESVTLLSPYPDPTLEHLQPGTMMISWTFGG